MKKFLIVAAIQFAALIAAAISPAHANVPCSVPFNLTNGTPADATQVMANYNAILSCLSTGAAASGVNSDITALNALSSPITGSCGVAGFTAVNGASPTTQININFTQASVTNVSNQVQTGGPASLTLSLNTSGAANGLDAGALAASSFYYIYLIGNGTTIASLGSLSSTSPTLPSGYSYKCRVGVWETGTGSALLTMAIAGRRGQLLQISAGGGSNITAGALQTSAAIGTCIAPTALALTTFAGIPPTAVRVVGITTRQNNAETYVSSFQNGLDNGAFSPGADIVTAGNFVSVQFDILLPLPQQFYVCNSGGVLIIGGWEDSVPAN